MDYHRLPNFIVAKLSEMESRQNRCLCEARSAVNRAEGLIHMRDRARDLGNSSADDIAALERGIVSWNDQAKRLRTEAEQLAFKRRQCLAWLHELPDGVTLAPTTPPPTQAADPDSDDGLSDPEKWLGAVVFTPGLRQRTA